jgi:hypothetical protein
MSNDLGRLAQQLVRKVMSNPQTRDQFYKSTQQAKAKVQQMYQQGTAGFTGAAAGAGAKPSASAGQQSTSSSSHSSSYGGQQQQQSAGGAGASGKHPEGFFHRMSSRAKLWQQKAADPKQREEAIRNAVAFLTMNFMGVMMAFQLLNGLYHSWQKSRQEELRRKQIIEHKEAEQHRMRSLARAAQGDMAGRGRSAQSGGGIAAAAAAVGYAAEQVTWASLRGFGWALAEGGLLVDYERLRDPLERTELSKWVIGGSADEARMSTPAAYDPLYNESSRSVVCV